MPLWGRVVAFERKAPRPSLRKERGTRVLGLFGAATVGFAAFCGAQEGKVVPSTPGNPYTLHVYTHRVQVPTMVLDKQHATERGLSADEFSVRLDKGPKFHPLQVRMEGDDPLAVAVLLDMAGGVRPQMLANFELELTSLPDELLTTRDHVSVYAVDCHMVQAPEMDIPATREGLDRAVTAVLKSTAVHGEGPSAAECGASRRLWDGITLATQHLGTLPGRRVMLVVSDGVDYGSANSWKRVMEYVDSMDVTVLGIRSGGPPLLSQAVAKTGNGMNGNWIAEDPFDFLCGGTGGITLESDADTVAATLEKAIRLVRERYVLDFLRPSNSAAGVHLIDVSVPDRKALVRPGGVVMALEDPALAKDPSNVPTDQSRAPVLGKRRVLTRSQ